MGRKLNSSSLFLWVLISFLILVVTPILLTLGQALVSLDWAMIQALLSSGLQRLLIRSLGISLIVSLLSVGVGGILAFFLFKTNLSFRLFFQVILLIPLFLSPYIMAVAWKDLGALIHWEPAIGSMVWVLVTIYTPLAMLIIGNALKGLNGSLEESALMLANTPTVFRKIIFPLIKPALTSAFVLIFILSLSEFSVPAYFNIKVLTTEIFTQFSAFYNHHLAVLQSMFLVLVSISLLFAEGRYLMDAPFLAIGTKGNQSKDYNYGVIGLVVVFLWMLVSVLLPFLILIFQTFKDGKGSFVKAFFLLEPTIVDSILLALLGALVMVLLGIVGAMVTFRQRSNKKYFFDGWMLLVFAIPSIVFGISLIKFYNHPILNFIYSSYTIILIGYVGKFAFISARIIGNAFQQIPPSLDESAEMMGISTGIRFRKILFPMISPNIFVAFMLGFIFCIGELGTSMMVYPPGTTLLPIKVYTLMANAPESLVSAMVLVVVLVTVAMVVMLFGLAAMIGKRAFGRMVNKGIESE